MLEFAKKDEQSKLLETLIEEDNDRRSASTISSTFDPRTLTECARRMLYRSYGFPHKSKLSYKDSQIEMAVKGKWLQIFNDCIQIRLAEKNVVVADSKYHIAGSINAVIDMNNTLFATQIKPVCEQDFNNIKQKGACKKDVVELMVYMWLLEIKDGLIVYDNNNNGDYEVYHIEPYIPIIKAIKLKCGNMVRNKMEESLPERSYKDSSSAECNSCEFINQCWDKDKE